MQQRTIFIVAGALTLCILVILGGIAANLSQPDRIIAPMSTPTTPGAPPPAVPLEALPTARIGAPPSAPNVAVTVEQAVNMALQAAPGARLMQPPTLVNFQGTAAYEVLLDQGVVYVHAQNEQVLYNGTSGASPTAAASGEISPEQAASIARTYAGLGTVRKVELDNDHGVPVYEVVLTDGSKVYVDRATGQVVYAQLSSQRYQEEHEHHEYESEMHDEE